MPLGTEVGLVPDDIVLDGDPAAPPSERSTAALPYFQPMSIVAKRSPISATAQLLFLLSSFLTISKGVYFVILANVQWHSVA